MKMIRFTLVLGTILSLGLMIQSCGSNQNRVKNNMEKLNPARMPEITGTWVLQSLNGQKAEDLFKGKIPSMTVDYETMRIYGSGGCNRYNGSFTLENGIFSAPNLASTMMMCPFENRESEFHQALAKSSKLAVINQNKLTLENEGNIIAEFVRGIDVDMLSGTWTLQSIEGEDMKALFPMQERQPSLEFNLMENSIGGNAGCNTYGASYTLEGSEIKVGNIMSTRMACENLPGENKYTQTLTGTNTINVSQEELTFSKDGKVTLRFVKNR